MNRNDPRPSTESADSETLCGRIRTGIVNLYPGYFALVMATGIISNALYLEDQRSLSGLLFALNIVAYPLLWLLTILRLLVAREPFWADITSPKLVFAFFTAVAATDVLGVGMHLRGWTDAATAMWVFALILWVGLIYFSFGVLTFLNTAHGANVVHGGWLIAIVGTQSLVILGAAIAPNLGAHQQSVLVLVHML